MHVERQLCQRGAGLQKSQVHWLVRFWAVDVQVGDPIHSERLRLQRLDHREVRPLPVKVDDLQAQESQLRIVAKLMDCLRKASHLCAREAVVQYDAFKSWQAAGFSAFQHHRPKALGHVANLELAQVDESGEEVAKKLDARLKPAMAVPANLDRQDDAGEFGTAYNGAVESMKALDGPYAHCAECASASERQETLRDEAEIRSLRALADELADGREELGREVGEIVAAGQRARGSRVERGLRPRRSASRKRPREAVTRVRLTCSAVVYPSLSILTVPTGARSCCGRSRVSQLMKPESGARRERTVLKHTACRRYES